MYSEDLGDFDFSQDIFDDFSKQVEAPQKIDKKRKIPVVMISGFLGSGKTTMLNNILRQMKNLKIGVIVNDFGKINIDSKLTAGNVSEKAIELSNGCICCMIGDNGLREPLDQLANENSKLDAILIEASGIAEPYDLMNTLRWSGNQFTYFGGNVYLVDCVNFNLAKQQFPTHFKKCLQTSDIVVLNKTDLADKNQIDEIFNFARDLNPRAVILKSKNSQIDYRLLFEKPAKIEETAKTEHDHKHNHHHIHDEFQSTSFSTSQPLSPQAFVDFLDNLPKNMFRLKGFCYFGIKGYEQKYLIQIVGKTIDISAAEWSDTENLTSELVLIGANMEIEAINRQLQSLIDHSPDEITPENMMNFERFFQKS